MGTCTRGELRTSGLGRHGGFVRTDRRHRFVAVCNRHDPTPERDVFALQSVRIAGAVKTLMVLNDGGGPFSQPLGQRHGEERPLLRVPLQEFPVGRIRFARIVEHGPRHGDLADVVKERRPSEPIPVLRRKIESVGNEIGEDTDPFRVPPRHAVVSIEGGGQGENSFSGDRGLVMDALRLGRANLAFERPGAARPTCDDHAARGPIRKHQRHLQEGGQWQRSPGQPARSEIDHPRCDDDQCPPGEHAHPGPRLRYETDELIGRRNGDEHGQEENREADEGGQTGARSPSIGSFGLCAPADLLRRAPTHSTILLS